MPDRIDELSDRLTQALAAVRWAEPGEIRARARRGLQEYAAAEIGGDHHGPPTHAIDPRAGNQPEDQPRDGTHRGKQRRQAARGEGTRGWCG